VMMRPNQEIASARQRANSISRCIGIAPMNNSHEHDLDFPPTIRAVIDRRRSSGSRQAADFLG